MQRRRRFVIVQTAWMFTTVIALGAMDVLEFELFFILSLMGFLAITALTSPFHVRPQWRIRLWWLILPGLLVFVYLVFRHILTLV